MEVSVLMITYNHEAFIIQAIESILMQETNFDFELIIGNDASNDNSDKLIKEFLEQNKEITNVKYFNHKNNLGIQDNFKFVHSKANGKYIAICEGDDFWIDPLKLKKQVSFLDSNLDYSLCYTRFQTLNQETKEYTKDFNEKYFFEDVDYIDFGFKTFQKGWHIGNQTLIFRNNMFDYSIYKRYQNFKDVHVITHLLNNGKGACLNFVSAVYRIHEGGIHSFINKFEGYRIGYETHQEIYLNNKSNPYLKKRHLMSLQNFVTINIQEGHLINAFFLSIKLFVRQGSILVFLRNNKRIIVKLIKNKLKNTLKIAMVTGVFPTVSETFVVNQILALRKAGHQVDIYCFRIDTQLIEHKEYIALKDVKELGWQHLMPKSYLSRIFKILTVLFNALKKGLLISFLKSLFFSNKKIINTNTFFKHYSIYYFAFKKYHVLHIHFGNNAVQLLPQLQRFPNRKIVTFHGFDAHKYSNTFYKGLIGISNINYTVNSHYTKQKILQIGFSEQQICILPVGLDTTFFKPDKKAHLGFNILFIGRLVSFKAPLLAIKITEKLINRVNNKRVHLNIVGDGVEFQNCLDYLANKKLEENITLRGSLNQNKVKDIMNISDVFLYPGIIDNHGRCENQGLVIQEAQAMELPVIISNVGGMKEGIIDRETGFVVNEKDVNAFVERLLFFINNPNEQKTMGKKGRKFVKDYFDNSVLGDQLLDLYIKN